eukprot:Gb_29055 [translate_table: standard]
MDSDQGKFFIGGISWETIEDCLKDYFKTLERPGVADRVVMDKHTIDGLMVETKRDVPRDGQRNMNRTNNGGYGPPIMEIERCIKEEEKLLKGGSQIEGSWDLSKMLSSCQWSHRRIWSTFEQVVEAEALEKGLCVCTTMQIPWVFSLGGRKVRQIEKSLHNTKVTIVVLRGTIGARNFDTPEQDFAEIQQHLSIGRRGKLHRVLAEATERKSKEQQVEEEESKVELDLNAPYSFGPKISDWDEQRRQWL